jgi:hypothetical protein
LRASGRFITIRAMRGSGRSTTMVSNSMTPSRFPYRWRPCCYFGK